MTKRLNLVTLSEQAVDNQAQAGRVCSVKSLGIEEKEKKVDFEKIVVKKLLSLRMEMSRFDTSSFCDYY